MSDHISPEAAELIDTIIAAFTLPPAAPDDWEARDGLLSERALYVRGVLGSAAAPSATLTGLASALRQIDTAPLCIVDYEIARTEDQAVTP
ncbi:hypothetical protein [Nocardiopsis sp. YSL2]|uniref:hypothetical protein n=1 Tax=Nocardiopsis sp. YSL2 TaxID=2939492 RepID=UPI0026F46B7C|nr:hypothetical protein [Nocardiopsis sp. YSL2]